MASNKKASGPALKHACLAPKGKHVGAVMPGVTLTSPLPASLTLQPLDSSGHPVALTPADTVTTTLTSDSPNFVITPGADGTHYVGTIPANTPQGSVANLAATMKGTIGGSPADLTASVAVTLDISPSPTAVDLSIIFA